jgi:membrane protein required for colicin V production
MPITWFDIMLLGIMLVSAFLAMIRGFMRELLSIAAWGIAAVAALYFAGKVAPIVKSQVNVSDTVAAIIAGVAIFLVALLVISIFTVRISDAISNSKIGPLDRTMGFLFGLGRGLILVAVAYTFISWLAEDQKQWPGIRDAKSVVVLKATRDWLLSLLPEDIESSISRYSKLLKKPKEEDQPSPEAGANQR